MERNQSDLGLIHAKEQRGSVILHILFRHSRYTGATPLDTFPLLVLTLSSFSFLLTLTSVSFSFLLTLTSVSRLYLVIQSSHLSVSLKTSHHTTLLL
jgi:hypothetical protein